MKITNTTPTKCLASFFTFEKITIYISFTNLSPHYSIYSAYSSYMISFFFQAEDGIRDRNVTGVQTCALPISCLPSQPGVHPTLGWDGRQVPIYRVGDNFRAVVPIRVEERVGRHTVRLEYREPGHRSEERRVGKECRSRRSSRH